MRVLLAAGLACLCAHAPVAVAQSGAFAWPNGKRAAVSLTFDDARRSHPLTGADLLADFETKVTFYVVPDAVEAQLDGWKRLVAAGHEMGNHSLRHPCSGNFVWARDKALETYTLRQMRREIVAANEAIERLLGVVPTSFAYPCGQSFVGRGSGTESYVPLIAALFVSGRGWLDEAPNDPAYVDMSQITGVEMDGKDFEEVRALVEAAAHDGAWLVLAGHEIGSAGRQTTRVSMLRKLLAYLQEPTNQIWAAPVGDIGEYVVAQRESREAAP